MIDYIKAYIANKEKVFHHLNDCYQLSSYSYNQFDKTREVMVDYVTYYKSFENLKVKFTSRFGFVENSLHSLFNRLNGSQTNRNDNDFCYSQLVNSIEYLESLLNCSPRELLLSQGLEFGFNLEVPFNVDNFIANDCIMMNFKSHSKFEKTDEKTLKEFSKSYYRIKIYNKGKQFGLQRNLLRIEIKYLDKRAFNNLGIYSVHDLLCKTNLSRIYNQLFTVIKENVLIVDKVNIENLSEYKKMKLYRFCSVKYWRESASEVVKKNKIIFDKMLHKNNLVEGKEIVLNLMNSKFNELINS